MMKTFPLNSRSKTTALKQPKELYSFSRDIDGEWQYDEEVLKKEALPYYYLPDNSIDSQIDLGAGYSKFKKIPAEQNVADFGALLKSIIQYEKNQQEKIKSIDIITFRGILTKLLTLPYNLKDGFEFYISGYDGQLFMKNNDEFDFQKPTSKDEYAERCEYSGYKFETISTLPKPWSECSRSTIDKRSKKVVNNYEQYISVVSSGVGQTGILLAGEVDCVYDYIPENSKNISGHYVELKTSKVIEHNGQVVNFEKKLFKTWAQSFLIGIRKIIYGFRDENLILRSVEVFKTDEIPILMKENPINQTNPNKIVFINAIKWYGAVIEWINNEIDHNDESKSYKLSYDPGSRSLSLIEVDYETNKKLRNGDLLTQEFKAWRELIKS